MSEPLDLTIAEVTAHTRSGQLSAVELVSASLGRIETHDRAVQAFVTVMADHALSEAARLDAVPAYARGPLHGLPIGIKDIFDVEGVATGRGSASFADAPVATADAFSVRQLRGAGAVVVGKTRTHELACGVYTAPTANPHDLARSAGGSSGGSGAAVAASMVFAGTGSDTGGSIRIPAALCGVTGLKPTYGRISRHGAATLAWSLDHVGILARSVADTWDIFTVMAGSDENDPATWSQPPLPSRFAPAGENQRVGVLERVFTDGLTSAAQSAWENALEVLSETVDLVVVDVDGLEDALAAEFTIVQAEAASYYGRLLGARGDLIGDDVRGVIEAGAAISATEYLDAQRTRSRLQAAFRAAFGGSGVAAVLAPTLPSTAHLHDQAFTTDEETEGVTDAYVRTTGPFNLTGLPSISVPVGLAPDGLPFGVQLAGPLHGEGELLGLAAAIEHHFEHVNPNLKILLEPS